jgi:hypothetical protein
MLAVLLHTESVKLELMLLFATSHTKQDLVLADSLLMQFAQIIHVQIWVVPMHRVLPKKAQQLQSG